MGGKKVGSLQTLENVPKETLIFAMETPRELDYEPSISATHGDTSKGPRSIDSLPSISTCAGTDTDSLASSTEDDDELAMEHQSTGLAAHADVMRATGTAANMLGSAAPFLHFALAPVSAVGGAVGAASGCAQLHQGLSMPSGVTDPHLVTKGSVTAGVGTTCMALGMGAVVVPGLLLGALVLGMTGLGVATTVDYTMDGLCPHCRESIHRAQDDDLATETEEAVNAPEAPEIGRALKNSAALRYMRQVGLFKRGSLH
jgi:hypothetical protein